MTVRKHEKGAILKKISGFRMLSGLREYEVRSNPYLTQVQSNKYKSNKYKSNKYKSNKYKSNKYKNIDMR